MLIHLLICHEHLPPQDNFFHKLFSSKTNKPPRDIKHFYKPHLLFFLIQISSKKVKTLLIRFSSLFILMLETFRETNESTITFIYMKTSVAQVGFEMKLY